MPIIFGGVCLLLSLMPLSSNQETKQSADATSQTQEVLQPLPLARLEHEQAGLQRFRRFDLEFSLVLTGFRETIVSDGPYMNEFGKAILNTFSADLPLNPTKTTEGYTPKSYLDLTVIVKNPPKITGSSAQTSDQLIRFLSEGEPEYEPEYKREYLGTTNSHYYRELRQKGSLAEVRPWPGQGVTGAIFCYSFISNRTYYPEKETSKTITATEWHFDCITLLKGRLLLLQFTALLPLDSPLPKDLLSRIESIISTLRLIDSAPVHSIKDAVAAAQACLAGEEWEFKEFDISKPMSAEETNSTGQKAWCIAYKKKEAGKGGQFIVIVSQDGCCTLTYDAQEQALQANTALEARDAAIARAAAEHAVNPWVGLRISYRQRPKLLKRVEPILPEEALNKQISGWVILELAENVYGQIIAARVNASNNPLLEQVDTEALLQWIYEPYIWNDFPKAVHFEILLRFIKGKFSAEESR